MAFIEARKTQRRLPPLSTVSELETEANQPVPMRTDPSCSSSSSSSPKSSWEVTLNDLSRGLQLICGSPASAGPMSPIQCTNPLAFQNPSTTCGESVSPPVALTPRKAVPRPHAKQLRRSDSVKGYGSQVVDRTIFVRHIETHAELESRLSEICRPATTPTGSPEAEVTNAQSLRLLLTTPFDRSLVRIRVNHPPEDLIVSVNETRHLVIETTSGSGRILHQSIVPGEVQVKHLVAYVFDDGVLVIRERTNKMADCCFTNTGNAFVPIMRQDASKMELKIAIHVPHHFRFEEIFVKTVDDRLVVVGKKKIISLPPGVALNFRSSGAMFRVMLKLPAGTDSRSVSASLTKYHQLVVYGKLGTTSRRYTI